MSRLLATLLLVSAPIFAPSTCYAWGREGHHVTVFLAVDYMRQGTAFRVRELLGSESLEGASFWADEYRHDYPETGAWHYIDIPFGDFRINMERECPQRQCVIGKTEEFLAVLKDRNADRSAKVEALKFVIHFVGDLHQPLHCEDDGDNGRDARHVIFDGHPDYLHWVWDTGLLQHINRDPQALAEELERRITAQDVAEWEKGSVMDWANEGHQIAQAVAYGRLGNGSPAPITAAYERQAEPVIELQLEKAGMRLSYLLNRALK